MEDEMAAQFVFFEAGFGADAVTPSTHEVENTFRFVGLGADLDHNFNVLTRN